MKGWKRIVRSLGVLLLMAGLAGVLTACYPISGSGHVVQKAVSNWPPSATGSSR